jgi:hypothetical protein
MRLRLAITVLCAVMFGIGMSGIVLTADFTKPWGALSAADWGWTFVSWAGDVAIVYLVVEYIDGRAWKKVEVKVIGFIDRELTGIAVDIVNVTGVYPIATLLPGDATEEEERRAFREAAVENMKRFAGDINSIKAEVQNQGVLFVGGYGPLFSHRAERLADFQLRYSRFLDARLVGLMMDLEDHLKALHSDVALAQRPILLASSYQQEAYRELQALLRRIVEAVESDEIQMP